MEEDIEKLTEQLEEVLDKFIKNPPKTSPEVVEIVRNCINHFGHPEESIFVCLMAMGNLMKYMAHICDEHKCEERFIESIGDPVVKAVYPFIIQIMSCKRFK